MQQNNLDFLTSQRVDGELLSVILARGRLSGEDMLRYAIEIGALLNRAHSRGLVHGSLSPYNIVISRAGARVLRPPLNSDRRAAPYCSPEQLRGEPADTRSDIFSYGAVLYEMASGKRAFTGAGGDLYHQILESAPPAFNGKSRGHEATEAVIAACLAKDPAARRQRIQNVVIDLKLSSTKSRNVAAAASAQPIAKLPQKPKDGSPWPPRSAATAAAKPQRMRPWAWWPAAALLIVLAAFAVLALKPPRPRAAVPVVSFRVPSPEVGSQPGPPAVSPDGRLLALPASGPDGRRMLWLRPLDDLRMTPLAGTEGASLPFWSPDSKHIGFFANRLVKRVPADGGPVSAICPADSLAGGGAWNSDGTILFARGMAGGLYMAPADGGEARLVLQLNPAKSELAFLWPQFLPGDKQFLFFVSTRSSETTGVYTGNLASPASYRLLFPSQTNAIFSVVGGTGSRRDGYLLFVRGRTPMAQLFRVSRQALDGQPIAIGENIGSLRSLLLAPISVSNNGTLVYQTIGEPTRQLAWLDRSGKQVAAVRETGAWDTPHISPDGGRAAAARLAPDGHADLWLLASDGTATQFTATAGHEQSPVWSADGSRLVFSVSGKDASHFELHSKSINGGKSELLYRSDVPVYPTDWSRDGRYLLFTAASQVGKTDIWGMKMADHHTGPIVATINAEAHASLSPDEKWIAYQSDESGSVEVYAQAFDGISGGTQPRWQVSNEGGAIPRWRADGRELYYISTAGQMMAVAVHGSAGRLTFNKPRMLFQTWSLPKTWNGYDVSGDGARFLMALPLELTNSPGVTVLTNWAEKLQRLAVN